ncbi:MAG: hypothetical protein LBQ52_06750 [Helicobacteraceae bacterium]|nr:hypothetical protein [Helicobacteraceae bacterium]
MLEFKLKTKTYGIYPQNRRPLSFLCKSIISGTTRKTLESAVCGYRFLGFSRNSVCFMRDMKRLFRSVYSLVFLVSPLAALDIVQTAGTANKEAYLTLTLKEERAFFCRVTPAALLQKGAMVCEFERVPVLKPQPIDNRFFTISPILENNRFTLKIDFKKQALVYALDEKTLSQSALSPNGEKTQSARWIVVGYEKTPPVLRAPNDAGLNFPISFPALEPPSIGALDLNGAPIANRMNSEDGREFSMVLESYAAGFLADAQKMIDDSLAQSGGKHLFMPELLALKIKILNKLPNQEEALISVARPWIEAYASHNETPEVLLLLGEAEVKAGLITDGVYHFETLIREYPKDRLADFARIYKADRFLSEGKVAEATFGYESVLFNSQDVPAASLAASRLAEIAIREDDIPKAAEFYVKILQSAPEFFLEDIEKSKELTAMMADRKLYLPAALLAEILIDRIEPASSEYEALLLNLARWQNLASMQEKSLISYERYLAEFAYSPQTPVAQKERDLLEFSLGRNTPEANLALYDEVISKYPDDEAASRALYEKSKTLMRLGRYTEVVPLLAKLDKLDKKMFHDFDSRLRQTETALLDSFLRANNCEQAVSLSRDHKLGATIRSDESFFNCAYLERDFNLALEIADFNVRKRSPAEGAEWIAKRLDALYSTSDYPNYIDGEERFIKMSRALRLPIEADRYIRLFDAYRKTDFDSKRMSELAAIIESRFPKEPRLMDIYAAMIALSRNQGDVQSQYDYAKKLVNRSRLTQTQAFTPDAEIAFAQAAIKGGKQNEAILVLQTTLNDKLPDRDRARALFMLGELYEQNASADLANATFERCANLELTDDAWANLCRQKTSTP